jgi:hypothetical protein
MSSGDIVRFSSEVMSARRSGADIFYGIGGPDEVREGTITSSPGPISSIARARCRAAVQLVIARACFAPILPAKLFSSSVVLSPIEIHLTEALYYCVFFFLSKVQIKERYFIGHNLLHSRSDIIYVGFIVLHVVFEPGYRSFSLPRGCVLAPSRQLFCLGAVTQQSFDFAFAWSYSLVVYLYLSSLFMRLAISCARSFMDISLFEPRFITLLPCSSHEDLRGRSLAGVEDVVHVSCGFKIA